MKTKMNPMNRTRIIATALSAFMLTSPGTSTYAVCGRDERPPNCDSPFTPKTREHHTLSYNCGGVLGIGATEMTHHVCNSDWKSFKPDTQMKCKPQENTGNNCEPVTHRCGWKLSGGCINGATSTCSVNFQITRVWSGDQRGQSISVINSCEKHDDNEPVEVAGGSWTSNGNDIRCGPPGGGEPSSGNPTRQSVIK
jgi:hypothetical protein